VEFDPARPWEVPFRNTIATRAVMVMLLKGRRGYRALTAPVVSFRRRGRTRGRPSPKKGADLGPGFINARRFTLGAQKKNASGRSKAGQAGIPWKGM